MKVFIGTSEKSAEHYMLDIVKTLYNINPEIEFYVQSSSSFKEIVPESIPLHVIFDSQLCAVMGLIEPLKRLPQLLKRRNLITSWIEKHQPLMVIGIDAPDFWLPIERFSKSLNIHSIHVVSPSVWAWRPGRVNTVASSAHELYALFDFEKKYYKDVSLTLKHFPHPLITQYGGSLSQEGEVARGFKARTLLCAPGSREKEVSLHLPSFLKVGLDYVKSGAIDKIIIPATKERKKQIALIVKKASGDLIDKVEICDSMQEALVQSSLALCVSGTATLECALFKVPTVVCYHLPFWKKFLLSLLIKTPFISLANIMFGRKIFPEVIGSAKAIEREAFEMLRLWFEDERRYNQTVLSLSTFTQELLESNNKACLNQQLKESLQQALMKQEEVL